MIKQFNIRDQVDLYGAFWPPDEPEKKFTGRLARDGEVLELTTSPVYKEELPPREFFATAGLYEYLDVLHGFTTDGPCSLLWLHSLAPAGRTDLALGQSLMYRQYRVGACVFGHHLPSAGSPFFSSVRLGYSGLPEWIPIPPQGSTPEEILWSPRNKPLQVFDFSLIANKTRLQLDIEPVVQFRFTGEYESKHRSQLTIQPEQPQCVEWYLKVAKRLGHLFSLLIGGRVLLESVQVDHEKEVGWLVKRDRGEREEMDRSVCVRCSRTQLANALSFWWSLPEEFESLEGLVYGTLRGSSLNVETEFLGLAQAIESFQRLTDQGLMIDAKEFQSILKLVHVAIDEACPPGVDVARIEVAQSLKDALIHSNEFTFRKRVDLLLQRISEQHRKELVGDAEIFDRTLRQTRNYFTHLGTKKKGRVLTGTSELFLFNQKVHALLRLLMLIYVGLPENQVFEPVLQQASKWK